MNFRFRSTYFALSILPATAGEDAINSAKGGLPLPPATDYSSKGVIDLPKLTSQPKSPWNFGFGISGRQIGKINFNTAPTRLSVPNAFGASSFTIPSRIGPETGLFNRDYDNGFVNPEPRTAATGRTTDYGYATPDQIQINRLEFYADGGERRVVTTSNSLSPSDWSTEDDWEISPSLTLSHLTDLGNGWSVGPSLHLSFTNFDGQQGGLNSLTATESRSIFDVRTIDQFDSTGLILPDAPYIGSPGAVAPLLPAEPIAGARSYEDSLRTAPDNAVFSDSIHENLDVNLFGVSIGAEAIYQSESNLITGIGAGFVLNLVDWDANRSDRLIQVTNGGPPVEVGSSNFESSGTDVLYGFYLQGTIGYQINESWSVQGNVRYDWSESLRDSVGESDFDVDLSGFSLGLGATYSF